MASSQFSSATSPWALLDEFASIGHRQNATTATAVTSAGGTVEVSFDLVAPPAISLWFIHFSAPGGKSGASAGADFEFLLGGCAAASMLPADELFSGGKLVPLRIPVPSLEEEASAGPCAPTAQSAAALPPKQAPVASQQQPETPRAEDATAAAVAKGVATAGGEEPKIPARRWRDLLRLRKQQASLGSGSSAAATTPSEPRPLRRLLRRGPKPPEPEPSLSSPLLREAAPDALPDSVLLPGGEHYAVVFPAPRFKVEARAAYDLRVFSSETRAWSTKAARVTVDEETGFHDVVRHAASKAITASGGRLAWIDLWRGVAL